MLPYFSIVVPCYNRANILPENVAAILKQQDSDFELILIDDGSKDNTLSVAYELAASDPRIRVFTQQNGERGAARNYGAKQARGRYINYFDSDDEMYPNHLRVVRDYIVQHGEVEVVHTGYEIINDDGQIVSKVDDFGKEPTNEALLFNNLLACNTVFVRRDIALNNPFVEDRRLASAEDWELWMRLASQYTFHSIEARTFCLREHAGRSLNTIAPETVRVRDDFFADLMMANDTFKKRYPNKINKFVSNRYTYITLVLALSKKHRYDTLRYLVKALKKDPTVIWRRRFIASLKHLI